MFNKIITKFTLALLVLVFAFSFSAFAEEQIDSSETSTTEPTSSVTSSEDTSSVASSQASSTVNSSKSSSVSDSSSKKSKTESSKPAKTTKKKTVSKPKKTEKKQTTASTIESSYYPETYNTFYDTDSISGEWEGKKTEIIGNTSSGKELSKHITNPKEAMKIWIFLPIVLGLASIGFLIYYDFYYIKNEGKHSAKKGTGKKEAKAPAKEPEEKAKKATQKTDDPFSAENFFNFDNEE